MLLPQTTLPLLLLLLLNCSEVQHVPLSEYRSNLASMVSSARQAGIDNLLLITPPPVHDEGRVKHQQQVGPSWLLVLC
jgi:hypothetical protein